MTILTKKENFQFQTTAPFPQRWDRFFTKLGLTLNYLVDIQKRQGKVDLIALEVEEWNTILLPTENKVGKRLQKKAEKLHCQFGKPVIIIQGPPRPGMYSLEVVGKELHFTPLGERCLQFMACRCCNFIELVAIESPKTPEFIVETFETFWPAPAQAFCPNCSSHNWREPLITDNLKDAYSFAMAR